MKTNTCVYQIYFTDDIPKRYIGSSTDIKQRWKLHKSGLKNGKYKNKPLQEAYNKYGIDNLKFFVIEYLPDETPQDVLFAVEQYWMDIVGFDNLYNICPNAADNTGFKFSEESKQKLSEAKRGENHPMHGKQHNEETKQMMSEAKRGENHPNYGIPAPNRNKEVWDNYHLIKDLHILNPNLSAYILCKLFNETFGTNYNSNSFQCILPKIKEEIVQRNS